ncbi:helix-turn-helix transcriptional regulator [Streptomyces xanthochromogenes]|uniref:helix-turn-helix domain-containing protein n=1 Tax=Streptomyces xanthochromogenes TaxID=67384 RepID=UPI002F409F20
MTSPLSTSQAAHKAVAERLNRMMQEAELSGSQLAALCGWHRAKTHRIIQMKALPKPADIRAWCAACGRREDADAIIETSRNARNLYAEWKQVYKARGGMARTQRATDLYRETQMFRVYSGNVYPGMLQTPEYSRSVLRKLQRFFSLPDEVEAAVEARQERSHGVLHEGHHVLSVVLEEATLYVSILPGNLHAEQLRYMLSVMGRPNVSFGIIPAYAPREIWPIETFYAFDSGEVRIETLTAQVKVTSRHEVQEYLRAFASLSRSAVYGDTARQLLHKAIQTAEGMP